ncbi:glycosyltransferase family 2 protein [Salibacter halophilus]|uniref:Glycosyltransferase family 2 protein n=1 Tax=Salibacter halophilus TaxID=1803916 RepID=A0A6N6MAA5_9FLAO|nr:glycosyltransferase family 2 protein [Salibacter halophilus]KAB1066101.1 glycosyltransferase family 2 protein [Salibacter halophilus]
MTTKCQNKVSIIMPVKNAAAWLGDSIRSIQNQSYENWELIAIDDHSSDDSFSILQSFSQSVPAITYYQNSAMGIIPALQLALTKTEGDFITRMDADDIMPENKLELLVENAVKNKGALTTGLVKYFSDDGKVSSGYLDYERWLNDTVANEKFTENMFRECVVASPNWLISRELLEKLEIFERLEYPEDYHMMLLLWKAGVEFQSVKEVTHLWREHPGRTSRNSSHYQQKAFVDLKVAFFVENVLDDNDQLVIFGSGRKANLAKEVLNKKERSYSQLDLKETENIYHYSTLPEIKNPKILIAVYPPKKERVQIEDFLQKHDFEKGKDYWFL